MTIRLNSLGIAQKKIYMYISKKFHSIILRDFFPTVCVNVCVFIVWWEACLSIYLELDVSFIKDTKKNACCPILQTTQTKRQDINQREKYLQRLTESKWNDDEEEEEEEELVHTFTFSLI